MTCRPTTQLTEAQLHEMLWAYCTTPACTREIARRFGMNYQKAGQILRDNLTPTTRRMAAARKRAASPLIWRRKVFTKPSGWLPSQEEIERMKREIRDAWTPGEAGQRWDRPARVPAMARRGER